MKNILICDAQASVHDALRMELKKNHFHVISAFTGEMARHYLKTEDIDVFILEAKLPDVSGIDLCREERKKGNLPIMFLSEYNDEIDRLVGLEVGADDYLGKPYYPREVALRAKKLLKRKEGQSNSNNESFSNLFIDHRSLEAYIDGELVPLTAKEITFLTYMIKHAGKVLSREQLLDAVWGYHYIGDTRSVDAMVKRLRKKIKECEGELAIETVYGVGYRLNKKDHVE